MGNSIVVGSWLLGWLYLILLILRRFVYNVQRGGIDIRLVLHILSYRNHNIIRVGLSLLF